MWFIVSVKHLKGRTALDFLDYDPIRKQLAEAVHKELCALAHNEKLATLPDIFKLLARPQESKWGDYAFPCFRYAKVLQKNPNELANLLKAKLESAKSPFLDHCDVAGAYLNISLSRKHLATTLLPEILSGKYFTYFSAARVHSEKVMIEYSQPNTHKAFHIGHTRNVALGDALVRTYRYLGYPVIAANYPGDEGTHIAKCLWYYKKNNLTPPSENRADWLGELYVQANTLLEGANEAQKQTFNQEISEVLKELESKQGAYYDLWKITRQWSLDNFYSIYQWLDVHFDQYFFESELSAASQQLVDEYLKKGVFTLSQGAIGMDLEPHKLGFMIVRKRDGNTLYATKDLALAKRKFEEFHIDLSIYIVASEQNHHFRQVFKTLECMGFKQASKCHHLSYGLVMLPEGKMSSRAGGAISFSFLRDSIEKELDTILAKYASEWTAEEIQETKKNLAIGAIKYGMLSTDPVKDIVFNLQEWLSFEGNSGPYLMYSYARSASILAKANPSAKQKVDLSLLGEDAEVELIRYLQDFNDVVLSAVKAYKPSTLTNYLFDLCKAFNRFYYNVPVLKADSKELMQARLALTEAFGTILEKGLNLIGIKAVKKM